MKPSLAYALARPFLFALDPETAHNFTLTALRHNLTPRVDAVDHPCLKQSLWGRSFTNPIGLAAGFDKNAEGLASLFHFGFGFVEAGTVTIKPQDGNPRPRVFRDVKNSAIINRMGFPNKGATVFKHNVTRFLQTKPRVGGVLGINIGMNKDQTNAADDYTYLIRSLAPLADYITINISSPNTPGLRDLQNPDHLGALLTSVMDERAATCGDHPVPILVKLAPDLSDEQLSAIAPVLLAHKVDGVILTNTTLHRPDHLPVAFRSQKGGLSGAPLTDLSTATIRRFYTLTNGALPIIGAGGVGDAATAYAKIRAGASLVQLYSGLVFHGPALVRDINLGLIDLLRADGFSSITDAVGADHAQQKTVAA